MTTAILNRYRDICEVAASRGHHVLAHATHEEVRQGRIVQHGRIHRLEIVKPKGTVTPRKTLHDIDVANHKGGLDQAIRALHAAYLGATPQGA